MSYPLFQPVLLDDKGAEIGGGDANGALCLKTPWPGIARTVYGDHRRFVETYFAPYPGYYFTGDGGHRDNAGYYQGSESISPPKLMILGHWNQSDFHCGCDSNSGSGFMAVVIAFTIVKSTILL